MAWLAFRRQTPTEPSGAASARRISSQEISAAASPDESAAERRARTVGSRWARPVGAQGQFGPEPTDPAGVPVVEEISIPDFPSAQTIQGALGADQFGQIWMGISMAGPDASAHLLSYDPGSGRIRVRGDVLSQLEQAEELRPGERQGRIATRIVEAADGFMYFASTDDRPVDAEAGPLPTWGSHLWRIDPATYRWQHLAAVREGLEAVGCGGPYIYALGCAKHVLFQYDTRSGKLKSKEIGAPGAHTSRNLLVDAEGHAYVPRVRAVAGRGNVWAKERLLTDLVELDEDLHDVQQNLLFHYGPTRDASSGGITALVYLADSSIVFATQHGYLYQLLPGRGTAAALNTLGWFHPQGTASTSALFTFTGRRYVAGLARRPGENYEWVVFDLQDKSRRSVALDLTALSSAAIDELSLSGSIVQDESGCFYVAGSAAGRAVVLRIHRARGTLGLTRPPEIANNAADSTTGDHPIAEAHQTRPLAETVLHGTAADWRQASAAEKVAMSEIIAQWLHPDLPERIRAEWSQRYLQELDDLAATSSAPDARFMDWLPLIHARLAAP